MSTPRTVYRAIRRLLDRIVAPLRADDSITQFTLSIPEAQTTTVDSVEGWANRPPAILRCSGCDTEIRQHRSRNRIDCPNCWRDFSEYEFADLELLAMTCPRCETEMNHGRRHPNAYEIPEWATCPNCQYHWDLNHWF
jgi:transposase-like protein